MALLAGGEMCVCDLAAVSGLSGGHANEQAERRVLRIIAVTFFVLAAYVVVAFGWWWADPAAALAVVWFAVREGRGAWYGELACDD